MRASLMVVCLLAGCAISRPDHFHALSSTAAARLEPRTNFSIQVNLRVSLPLMVDRSELVVSRPGGVSILEHERWAAPLADQFAGVLGQDIEARRQDVLVTSRAIAQPGAPAMSISVDVAQLALQEHVGSRMEVRWRTQRGSEVVQSRETFVAPEGDSGYDGLVQSLNTCIGMLAERLSAQLPP
jgi:uncharacterized lipoprotein YmbA